MREGRVKVNGRTVRDPEHPVDPQRDRVEVDGARLEQSARRCLALNKPRGLVTTRVDERGRDTVYACLAGIDEGWLAPVGRLDKASEGLLLFTNDPTWAAAVLDPQRGPDKTYHVRLDAPFDPQWVARLEAGITIEPDQPPWRCRQVRLLREAERSCWVEVVLDEGRNRQIRRLFEALGAGVLRLVRVAIGDLLLGELAKGAWRWLDDDEIRRLVADSPAEPGADR
ncbi:rRNA pseudouridine synthase [Lysobacter sp. CAU 1642]|uniref:Pseudouridine synthase n=1 Tax=Pseudomarimonas salicorniae TaxID=2933270 RepID=A0ABT0GH48_9GAMM|nr:rRNA pseudouridine synthase [Lysobacter sp. CAU 1642]